MSVLNQVTGRSEASVGTNGAAHVVSIPFNSKAKVLQINGTSTTSVSTALPGQGNILRLVNEGPNNCYISITNKDITAAATLPSTSTAANTSVPVLAGSDISLSISPYEVQNIAVICRAASTCVLLVSVGEGV